LEILFRSFTGGVTVPDIGLVGGVVFKRFSASVIKLSTSIFSPAATLSATCSKSSVHGIITFALAFGVSCMLL
jgi:hypothetical protein